MKYRILTICGSGIATSTVAAEKMRQMLNDKGYDVDVVYRRNWIRSNRMP